MKARTWTLLIWLLLAACAQVREITGGDKDEDPPILLAAYPPHLSTNFTGQRIVLQFNERIQLDRVRDRLLVSPPLAEQPTVRITGAKNVTIDLNAPLKENTTYTFAIGEAVKDLSEGNAASGLTYVVSTGDVVDSMLVTGNVVNAYTGKPEKEVLVSLYATDDTAKVRSSRPAYATRSDAEGRFALKHLRPGSYRAYALRDQNANFRYDLPNEEIAFLDSLVVLDPTDSIAPFHTLRLFREVSAVQALRESRVLADGAVRLVLAKPGEDLSVRDVARSGGTLTWTNAWSETRDTVLLWPSDTTALTLGRYELRSGGVILDTIRYRMVERMPFATGLRARVVELENEAMVDVRAARPIAEVDTSRIRIVRDSLALPYTLERDSVDQRLVHLRTDLPPGSEAVLVLLPKAIRDIYGGENDSLRTGLGRAAEKSTGTLRIRLEHATHPLYPRILQLLDAQGNVVRRSTVESGLNTVVWERLMPGNHTLRMIMDRNGNGRWDTGALDQELQPEQVLSFGETINVRAAWDLAVDLKVE
jgi:hypothetical protein